MTDTLAALSAALADRYTIKRELGAGGMATVFLAHDVRHSRKVALRADGSRHAGRVALAVALLAAWPADGLLAQCPDGTPPP